MRAHSVTVDALPDWVPASRLLGPGDWSRSITEPGWSRFEASLPADAAADVQARLRGVGLGGRALLVTVRPGLGREAVRAARTVDARRRRDTTPGFERRGTRLDDEGRMSLTPEALAAAIARTVPADAHVLDCGAGAGGNAIAFARAGLRVTAVEQDAPRLALAKHNARVYGVAERIAFVHGDALEVAARTPGALRFVDPPWGAEWSRARTEREHFPLLSALSALPGPLWAKVPPSFAPETLSGGVPEAYFGAAAGDAQRVKFVLVRRA